MNHISSVNNGTKSVETTPDKSLFDALTRNRTFAPTICGGNGLSAIRSNLLQLKPMKSTRNITLFFNVTNKAKLYMTDELAALCSPTPADYWNDKTGQDARQDASEGIYHDNFVV